jgi:hypothetical protein
LILTPNSPRSAMLFCLSFRLAMPLRLLNASLTPFQRRPGAMPSRSTLPT